MAKIELLNIQKKYRKKTVLSGVNLSFEENTIYGLLGRNGAGKSTLLNIINNRTFPTKGQVFYQQKIVADKTILHTDFFLTGDQDLYHKNMKVTEIFKWTKEFYGEFDDELSQQLLKKFKLNPKQKFSALSTGYRSITKLIVALCVPCKFIFLDEPVLGLDATHRDLFYKELIQTYSERPRTFVISTHLIEEITGLLEKVVIIDRGNVLLNTSSEDLLKRAKVVRGPEDKVKDFCQALTIIGKESLGNYVSYYTLDLLPDVLVPDEIDIDSCDLQKLFILLTTEEAEQI